jgi:NAD dependent epimerase/dehydratase family enzyme
VNVLVTGATGKTGILLVKQLQEHGHHSVALVHSSSDTSLLPDDVPQRYGDLTDTHDSICDSSDAVVFAARSGENTDLGITEKVDRGSAKHVIVWPRKRRFHVLKCSVQSPPPILILAVILVNISMRSMDWMYICRSPA